LALALVLQIVLVDPIPPTVDPMAATMIPQQGKMSPMEYWMQEVDLHLALVQVAVAEAVAEAVAVAAEAVAVAEKDFEMEHPSLVVLAQALEADLVQEAVPRQTYLSFRVLDLSQNASLLQ
jgi:hypothetical protein